MGFVKKSDSPNFKVRLIIANKTSTQATKANNNYNSLRKSLLSANMAPIARPAFYEDDMVLIETDLKEKGEKPVNGEIFDVPVDDSENTHRYIFKLNGKKSVWEFVGTFDAEGEEIKADDSDVDAQEEEPAQPVEAVAKPAGKKPAAPRKPKAKKEAPVVEEASEQSEHSEQSEAEPVVQEKAPKAKKPRASGKKASLSDVLAALEENKIEEAKALVHKLMKAKKAAGTSDDGEPKKKRQPSEYNIFVQKTLNSLGPEIKPKDRMKEAMRIWAEHKAAKAAAAGPAVKAVEAVEA